MRGFSVCEIFFMTIKEALQQVDHHDRIAVEVLLARALKAPKEQLFAYPERDLSQDDMDRFLHDVERLRAGEPLAYIIGEKEFYGLEFEVNEHVLIPRPETELMVDKVKDFVGDKSLKILDVGTGSGAIAVAIAHVLPQVKVVATDVSGDALEVAKRNAVKHEVQDRIRFLESDLLENIDEDFDVIVANLPYIGEERFRFVSKETEQFEPHVALFGGMDGLQLYRKLFEDIHKKGLKPGLLIGEFGFAQAEEMELVLSKFFEQNEWHIEKDYASIERIFVVNFANA